MDSVFIIDPARCIGCQACVHACAECDTHRGVSLIHLESINRAETVQTTPQVCMHCENPTCAQVCPADAIKQTPDGVVQSSLKPRCIGCSNCVLACPFGVPKYESAADQMMKCDRCYDRTSAGKRPMCATVCPSEALYYGSMEEWRARRGGALTNKFRFGRQSVTTMVYMVLPGKSDDAAMPVMDVRLSDIAIRSGRVAAGQTAKAPV
ncbi:MAG: 4Fe-4S binding protein [Armatimonadetes bacterium]|nr:4Fe-4S binding protein [Armatimonadota bacterium]MDE2205777.1 4Fe-4S binding protein [Armatimonadota bacterium]